MEIKKVGVVGCGLMGSGIAQTCAKAGYQTAVNEATQPLLDKGRERITKSLDKAVEKGKATSEQMQKILDNLSFTHQLSDLKDCDLIIEAIIENMDEKKKLWKSLDKITRPEAIFASNTSSLSIVEMASVTSRVPRVVGMHFFNPVPIMKLVEMVKPITVAEDVFVTARKFAESLGKTIIVAKDTPGFIVNLLLIPYLLDAIRALERGIGSREDIDTAMTLGCGHPMGPLTLTDFIGADTTYYIAEAMYQEFKDPRYAPPPLLKSMVIAGFHGRKSGKGFYTY
ncbi:MAG: 3-hydroxyacyl-CoA dehydrogenase NAD-binding domain-containing protein [candidate division Zixibacteria bacterium]|nr:3-hydroxyacyl-CoA dehydrogenase NAD-binding domain-containing protein [candidate division Zixibacteria bacterium]